MKTVTPRNFTLALGVAVALLASAGETQAGSKEIIAISNKLPGGTTTSVDVAKANIAAASKTDLSNAVIAAIGDPLNIKLLPATIAGEALKGANSSISGTGGIGAQLATDIVANLGNTNGTFPKIALNVQAFVGDSAEIAATGTAKNDFAANATNIPFYADVFISRGGVADRNAETLLMAENATKSTTAVGAIFGGRTLNADLDTAQERIDLAKQGLADKKLTKAAQQIAQYVGDDVVDNAEAATFALAVVKGNNNAASTKDNNSKYIIQIATGTSTSNTGAASGIVDALFDGVTANQNVPTANIPFTFTAAVKNATKLASSVGLVADAEQVEAIGVALGGRVDLTNTDPATAKTKIIGIKNSAVSAFVKSLVLSLTNRPTHGYNANADTVNGNNRTNRIDEIGEVGAYVLNAVKGLAMFHTNTPANQKAAPKFINTLLKTIISTSAKVWSDAQFALTANAKKSIVKDITFQTAVADDAAGSIALTLTSLASSFDPQIVNAIKASLVASANSIAGKTLGPTVIAAMNSVFNNTNAPNSSKPASQVYEDGTIAADALDVVAGAETDVKTR